MNEDRIERAGKAAFAQHVRDTMTRGKFIVGVWDDLAPDLRAAWRSIGRAAIESDEEQGKAVAP